MPMDYLCVHRHIAHYLAALVALGLTACVADKGGNGHGTDPHPLSAALEREAADFLASTVPLASPYEEDAGYLRLLRASYDLFWAAPDKAEASVLRLIRRLPADGLESPRGYAALDALEGPFLLGGSPAFFLRLGEFEKRFAADYAPPLTTQELRQEIRGFFSHRGTRGVVVHPRQKTVRRLLPHELALLRQILLGLRVLSEDGDGESHQLAADAAGLSSPFVGCWHGDWSLYVYTWREERGGRTRLHTAVCFERFGGSWRFYCTGTDAAARVLADLGVSAGQPPAVPGGEAREQPAQR